MSKITKFDDIACKNVRAAMNAALAQVEKEFGIKIQIGGIKYTPDAIKTTLDAMIDTQDPMMEGVDPKYVQEITRYVNTVDLYKKDTIISGVKCTIVGMKPRTSGRTLVVRRSSDNSLRLVDSLLARANLVK